LPSKMYGNDDIENNTSRWLKPLKSAQET